MSSLPKKVEDRLITNLKHYQPIVASLRDRDVNESDTVTLVTDLLSDLFGYDKYHEITREFCIRGTYCDLAVKIDNKIYLILEVKAIGLDLKDSHCRQAVDYAANQGQEWVVLTNGAEWRIYRLFFTKPINTEMVLEFNFLDLNHKNPQHLEWLFLLTKEAINKTALQDFHTQRQATNRFSLAAVILGEPVMAMIRRELRRLHPNVQIQMEELREILQQEVLKREIIEGDPFKEAAKKVQKIFKKTQKPAATNSAVETPIVQDIETVTPTSTTKEIIDI